MMVDIRKWPVHFVREFVGVYRRYPCLYDPRDDGYRDRGERARAYLALFTKAKEGEEHITMKELVAAVQKMRSLYRKEFLKARKARVPVRDYKTNLNFFHMLHFLPGRRGRRRFETVQIDLEEAVKQEKLESGIPQRPQSSQPSPSCSPNEVPSAFLDEPPTRPSNEVSSAFSDEPPTRPSNEVSSAFLEEPPTRPSNEVSSAFSAEPPTRPSNEISSAFLAETLTRPSTPSLQDIQKGRRTGSFGKFGQYLSDELDRLPPLSALSVQKIINDAIFKAKMEALRSAND